MSDDQNLQSEKEILSSAGKSAAYAAAVDPEKSSETMIFCYSGCGNSLWVSLEIARRLGEPVNILPIPDWTDIRARLSEGIRVSVMSRRVGIIFPVLAWAPPRRLRAFLQTVDLSGIGDIFCAASHAGQPASALKILNADLKKNGCSAGARLGFEIRMPSTFGENSESREERREFISAAGRKIAERIVPLILSHERRPMEQGSMVQRLLLSSVNPLCTPNFGLLGRFFRSNERCTGCGVCTQLCPSGNIRMTGKIPVFSRKCEFCASCFQWCPAHAIQYSTFRTRFRNYTHPDISLREFLNFRRSGIRISERKAEEHGTGSEER